MVDLLEKAYRNKYVYLSCVMEFLETEEFYVFSGMTMERCEGFVGEDCWDAKKMGAAVQGTEGWEIDRDSRRTKKIKRTGKTWVGDTSAVIPVGIQMTPDGLRSDLQKNPGS